MINVEDFLKDNGIGYILYEHPAVYTCEEAEQHCGSIPGLACKNLFLTDKKGSRYFLAILPAAKRTDLKKLAERVGETRLTFAKPEVLQEKLGLTPGSVSPFGLLNDTHRDVEVYIDKEVYDADIVSFHPNRNTASVQLSGEMLQRFLQVIEHVSNVIEL